MTDQDFLSTLKEGDKVAVKRSYYGTISYTLTEVERITPSRQIKVKGYPEKFRDGRLPRGDSRMNMGISDVLVPITDDVHEVIERAELLAYFSNVKFKTFGTEKLRLIRGILEGEN